MDLTTKARKGFSQRRTKDFPLCAFYVPYCAYVVKRQTDEVIWNLTWICTVFQYF
jgi:hypothetical protein